jgi:predicted dehydrogenase
MLRVHTPQILVVATHPNSHYYYCRLAAAANVPVIICEKPLADNIREARKIARLAKQGELAKQGGAVQKDFLPRSFTEFHGGKDDFRTKTPCYSVYSVVKSLLVGNLPLAKNSPVIITNHERRYSGDYIRARAILAEAALGKLLSARAVLYMGKSRRLLNVLWHDGTHLADALMFLTNARLKHRRRWGVRLSAHAGTAWLEGELCAEKTTAPVPVVIEIGAGRDHLAFEIEFSCEKGRLRIGNGIFEVWESAPSPYAEKFRSLKQTSEIFTGPTGYFANMVQDAVSCVQEPGRQPCSGVADGLKVIEYLNSVSKWNC